MPKTHWLQTHLCFTSTGPRSLERAAQTCQDTSSTYLETSTPDSLPVIGRSPRFSNVVFAFGHGHCGMMMGARTGQLAAALLADRDPGIDMSPYRVDRF